MSIERGRPGVRDHVQPAGRRIASVVNTTVTFSPHQAVWGAAMAPSGAYFWKKTFDRTDKMDGKVIVGK